MSNRGYKGYFGQPDEALHRRYEALRSVFVEEQPMKTVAQRFDASYGTVRNWVSEFRQIRDAGQSPPFSPSHRQDVRRPMNSPMKRNRKSKSRMSRRYRWSKDAG